MTERELAEQYHNQRGISLIIQCSKCCHAGTLGIDGIDSDQEISLKIIWAGAADAGPDENLHPENDEETYSYLSSPFPETPKPILSWGLKKDSDNNLWMGYYSQAFIKHPALFKRGLKLVLEVPEELANKKKKPALTVLCNDEEVIHTTLEKSGRVEWIISIDILSQGIISYLYDTRRHMMILLDELERVCEKYDLTYYMICGGLIGVMRSGNLIPWDDDLDIAMTREDYDTLLSVAGKEWPQESDFYLVTPESYGDGVFLDYMTRLVYMKEKSQGDVFARISGKGREDIHYHAPLDIYVLDKTPDGAAGHFLQTRKILLLYILALGHRGEFQPSERNSFSKLKLAMARLLMRIGSAIPLNTLLRWYNSTAQRYRNRECGDYFQSNGYFRCFSMRFPRSWFGSGGLINVETRDIRVPDKPKEFLMRMYGNYNQYPYFEFRKPEHIQENSSANIK